MKKMFSPRCVTSVILLVSLLLAGGALAQGLPEKWDDEADVVVVGYGAAGAAAAAEAHDAGADVLLLEKLAFPGGNALLCGGAVYGAGTSVQKELGIDDSPEQMAKYYEQIKPGLNKPEFIEIISAKSAEAVEWLLSHGAKVPAKYGVPGLTAGGFENLYEHITPARTRSHWVESGGPGLFAAFKNAVDSRGIRVQFNTRATRLIRNPATGDIVGVRAVAQNGKEMAIKARKGVVLATGGFVHNKDLLKGYAPGGDGYPGAKGSPGATGDGILMAQEMGAALWAMHEILESLGINGVGTAYFTPFMEYTVIVNKEGNRFIREDAWTEPITEEALKQPGAVAFLVFDSKLRARDEVNTTVGVAIPEDKVIEAASIPELAEKLGVDPDALQATVDEYNTYCETGEDPLGKGKKALFPCTEAPFYGIIADPLPVITTGGLLTSVEAEVLNPFNEPISRLYAAGEVTGGKCVGYPGCGTAIAECIIFGRIAGRNAAQLPDW